MQTLLQILGQMGATFLAGLLVGLVLYITNRLTKTATAGVVPVMVDHGAWATPLRTAAAAAGAVVLVVKCFLGITPLWIQMLDAAFLIGIVGTLPTAFRGLPSTTVNAAVGAGIVAGYAVIGIALARSIGDDAAGYVAAGLAVGGVAVARALAGVPDAAWYAANQPPAASVPVAGGVGPTQAAQTAAPAAVGGATHYVLPADAPARFVAAVAGQKLAKGGFMRFCSAKKAHFSPLPSARPQVVIIAGPKGSGRNHVAHVIAGIIGANADEAEGSNGVAGDVGKVDWLRHLTSGAKMAGRPAYILWRDDIDVGGAALAFMGSIAATGRASNGDDWTRAILTFVVDVDADVAAAANTVEGRDALTAKLRERMDPRLVDVASILVCSLPSQDDQIAIAEMAIRREAARHKIEVADIDLKAVVDIVSSATSKSGVGLSQAVDLAAVAAIDLGFANAALQKKKRAKVTATGAVEAIA